MKIFESENITVQNMSEMEMKMLKAILILKWNWNRLNLRNKRALNFCVFLFFWLFLQGCISISMSLHQTSFCFVCSHLASGEKEGDELKRNADVAEILKSTQFPKICKNPSGRAPERITDHEYVILNF